MQANDFDEALRQKFETYQPEYNAASWKAIAEKLPVKKSSIRLLLWPVGLGLAASLAAAYIILIKPFSQKEMTVAIGSNPALPPIGAQAPLKNYTVAGAGNEKQLSKQNLTNHVGHTTALLSSFKSDFSKKTKESIQLTNPILADNISSNKTNDKSSEIVPNAPSGQKKEEVIQGQIMPLFFEKTTDAKTIISLSGGLQSGSLNTGYTAGVQIQCNLSDRWYVATEIGYQNYGTSGTKQVSSTDYAVLSRLGINMFSSFEKQSQIKDRPVAQYLMASPMIGYHVAKRINLGTGIDFQRALQPKGDKSIQVDGDEIKLLPILDIGAMARIGFRISKNFEAGLLYRQGFNNLLKPNQSYLNRRYLQVQLKMPLFRK